MNQYGKAEWDRLSEQERQSQLAKMRMLEKKLRREGKYDELSKLLGDAASNSDALGVRLFIVCVTEQHYVSIFFTRLWSVRKPLLFDTQKSEISGFSTAHAYKYKSKRQAKMKRDSKKIIFLLISHKATLVLNRHKFAHRP